VRLECPWLWTNSEPHNFPAEGTYKILAKLNSRLKEVLKETGMGTITDRVIRHVEEQNTKLEGQRIGVTGLQVEEKTQVEIFTSLWKGLVLVETQSFLGKTLANCLTTGERLDRMGMKIKERGCVMCNRCDAESVIHLFIECRGQEDEIFSTCVRMSEREQK